MNIIRYGVRFCLIAFAIALPAVTHAQLQKDVDARDKMGWTQLMHAASLGAADQVKRLIALGANVNVTDERPLFSDDYTPLMLAAFDNHDSARTAELLLQAGADPDAVDQPDGRTALLWAVLLRHAAVAGVLIDAGANVNLGDHRGKSPMMAAAYNGNPDLVQRMINASADVNHTSADGTSPLIAAAYGGNPDVVQMLLKAKADVNRTNNNGNSALMFTVWGCHRDVAQVLLDAGARLGPHDWKKVRPPQMSDFPVTKIYKGRPSAVAQNSSPIAREYKTRIKEAAKGGPDFAGHYSVAEWGCGSNCQAFAFIDSQTGKVFDPGGREGADRGFSFTLNSTLFIQDPPNSPDSLAYEDDISDTVPVRYYVWKEPSLVQIYEEPCIVEGHQQKCGCMDLQQMVLNSAAK